MTERLRFTVLFALLVGVAAASVWPAWGIAAVALTFVATVLAISVAAAVRYGRRWEWTQHSTVRRS